jgi:hypothetical protein
MRLPDMGSQDDKRCPIRAVRRCEVDGYRAELLTIARSGQGELPPGLLSGIRRRQISHGGRRSSRVDALNRPLQCVSSGYLSGGCSCRSSIPGDVVAAAWRDELERGRLHGGFFHFAWRGGVWLAYGLPDGWVRGVYCPAHRAEREERLGYDPELDPAAIEQAR